MSEEEKKAIEWLEKANYFSARLYAPTILNLINNYKKEIEEKTTILLAGAEKVKQLEKEIKEGYHKGFTDGRISMKYEVQDKIREKIKELEEQKEKIKYDGNRCFADYEQFCKNLKFFKEQIDELL